MLNYSIVPLKVLTDPSPDEPPGSGGHDELHSKLHNLHHVANHDNDIDEYTRPCTVHVARHPMHARDSKA
jgi:hypothetical protein